MTYNVDPSNYYDSFKENPYPETYPEGQSLPEGSFRQGDVVFDTNHKKIALVMGTICDDGDLRLDSDGMQPIENLRYATLSDFERTQYGNVESHKQLFEECAAQQGVKPMKFQVVATVKKNEYVYVTIQDDLGEDDYAELGKEMAHSQFSPLNDGKAESYAEDSDEIPNIPT